MKFTIRELLVWMSLCSVCFALTALPVAVSMAVFLLIALVAFFLLPKNNWALYTLFSLLGVCFVLVMSEVLVGVFEVQVTMPGQESRYEAWLFSVAVPVGVMVGSTFALIFIEQLRKPKINSDDSF